MTREEAIKILRREIECLSHTKCEDCILEAACDPIKTTPYDSEYIEVYEMAIKALENNESAEDKGDLISRKSLLNKINAYVVGSQDKEFICKLIKEMPSVENKGEWIPVSERLPEEEEEVLCQLSDDSCAVLYMQDNWGQMEWVDGQMGTGTYDVIAWQSLPEPYKAESEE